MGVDVQLGDYDSNVKELAGLAVRIRDVARAVNFLSRSKRIVTRSRRRLRRRFGDTWRNARAVSRDRRRQWRNAGG